MLKRSEVTMNGVGYGWESYEKIECRVKDMEWALLAYGGVGSFWEYPGLTGQWIVDNG